MMTLNPQFVEFIPKDLADGILYIAMEYATAVHKCACGCGIEIVTPLSRKGWQMYYDGESVSLVPSIGNWNIPCRSHYFIHYNNVEHARAWQEKEMVTAQIEPARKKKRLFKKNKRRR